MLSCDIHRSVFRSYLGYASEESPHLSHLLLWLSSVPDLDCESVCVQPVVSPRSDGRCYGTAPTRWCRQRAHSSDSQCGTSRSPSADWCHSADARILRPADPARCSSYLWAHLSLRGVSQSTHSFRQWATEWLLRTARTDRRALWPPSPTAASSSWGP